MQVSNHVTVVYTGLDLVTVEVTRRLLSRVCSAVLTPASGCSRRTKKTAITQTHQMHKTCLREFWGRDLAEDRGKGANRTFAQRPVEAHDKRKAVTQTGGGHTT